MSEKDLEIKSIMDKVLSGELLVSEAQTRLGKGYR